MNTLRRAPFAWRPVFTIAAAELFVLVAFGNGYGYHRDELYFRVAARHPAFGYPDQPPLTPLLGRLSESLFGESPRGLRVVSALAMALTVVIVALIARELGGGRSAQTLAAVAAAVSGLVPALGHIVSTATFDFLAWLVVLLLVTRILGGGDRRQWLAVGAVVGVSLQNKQLVLLLCAALAVGIGAARRWDVLRTPWLPLGVVIAVAFSLPNLVWQAGHGWPQLELAEDIASESPGENRLLLVPFQFLAAGLPLAPLLVVGLVRLLTHGDTRPFRALAYGYLALLALCLLTAAKPYYASPYSVALLAPGAIAAVGWAAGRGRRTALLVAGCVASAALSLVLTQPVVPVGDLHASPAVAVNEDMIETVGWPELADAVDRVADRLPPAERRRAVVFTDNYGEAGALARYGPDRGLPPVYSGHNGFGDWGPPPDGAAPVIVVGRFQLESFDGCRRVVAFDNGVDLDNEEQGVPISVCAGPRRPWSEVWPELTFLSA